MTTSSSAIYGCKGRPVHVQNLCQAFFFLYPINKSHSLKLLCSANIMFLEHNSNIVLEILDIIMLCKHNVPEAYFILRQMP